MNHWIPAFAASLLFASAAVGEDGGPPSPIMTQPDRLFYEDSFDTPTFKENILIAQDETRWNVKDGLLFGQPSPIEHQRSRGGHNGAYPLVQIRTPGPHFCVNFRVRFDGTGIAYQGCAFGISRYGSGVSLNALGTSLGADHQRLMHDSDLKLIAGKWYDCTFEIQGNEICVQFGDGPTLYGQHNKIYGKHGSPEEMAANGIARPVFQIRGATSGTVELDDVKIWSIKSQPASDWPATKSKLTSEYSATYGNEPNHLDRKQRAAALKALAEKDPNYKAIQAARAAEADIKNASKAAAKKKFSDLSPEEQEAKRKRKAELLEKRKAAKAGVPPQ